MLTTYGTARFLSQLNPSLNCHSHRYIDLQELVVVHQFKNCPCNMELSGTR
jgi:hypothetical protein